MTPVLASSTRLVGSAARIATHQGAARAGHHLEPGRRLDQQREHDHGRRKRIRHDAWYQSRSARAVGEEDPDQSVCERQGDADLRRQQARFRHRTQEEPAGENEEHPADQREDGDWIVRVPPGQAR
jgi:hypothetical protein